MSEEDESSEYNSDHNAESEDQAGGSSGKSKDSKSSKAYKKNLMKRYRKLRMNFWFLRCDSSVRT